MAKQSESPPYRREVSFAPGEVETVLDSLGFSLPKLKDDHFLSRAIDAVGGCGELERLVKTHRYLVSLSRPQLGSELMVRLSLEDWGKVRERVRFMTMSDVASMVIGAECKNRFGNLVAAMHGMT